MKLNKKDIMIGLSGGIAAIGIGFNALYYACASITTPTTQIEIFNEVDFNSMSTKELSKKFSKSMAHMISSKDYQTSVTVEYLDNKYWIDFDIHTNCRTNEYTKGYKVLEGNAVYSKEDGFNIISMRDNRGIMSDTYLSEYAEPTIGCYTQEEMVNALESILSDLN